MAYTLDNLRTDIRNYTEVGSNVLSDSVLERIIKNAELKIHRAIDTDQSVFYATSNLIINNRIEPTILHWLMTKSQIL
jgi:hypothetical protein